jgi:hypothetical protein
MALRLRKVLGGAQPPRDGAEAEGYRSRMQSRKWLTTPYKPQRDLIGKFVAVSPVGPVGSLVHGFHEPRAKSCHRSRQGGGIGQRAGTGIGSPMQRVLVASSLRSPRRARSSSK